MSAIARDEDGRPILRADGHTARVLQVTHGRGPQPSLDPAFVPIENPRLSRYFEATVIVDAIARGEHEGVDFFGVVSPRFATKIPLDGAAIVERMSADGFAADCYSFFGRLPVGPVWRLAERKHPGILRAAEALLDRLGAGPRAEQVEAPAIYQNHFLCRSAEYGRYVEEMLMPALKAMDDEMDTELQELLQQDPGYADPRFSTEDLETIFGRPRFTMHPFVAERLFSTWLGLGAGLRVHHIWDGRFVAADDIVHEPEMVDPEVRS